MQPNTISFRFFYLLFLFHSVIWWRAHCIMRNFLVDLSCAFAQHQQPSVAATAAERTTVTRNIKQRGDGPEGKNCRRRTHEKYAVQTDKWRVEKSTCFIRYLSLSKRSDKPFFTRYIFLRTQYTERLLQCVYEISKGYILKVWAFVTLG